MPIMIGIFQNNNLTIEGTFSCTRGVGHIPRHFYHPHSSLTVKSEGHRGYNLGFGCYDLYFESRFYLNLLQEFSASSTGDSAYFSRMARESDFAFSLPGPDWQDEMIDNNKTQITVAFRPYRIE